MKYARVGADNRCAEFIDFDPSGVFPAGIEFVLVPEALEEYVNSNYNVVDGNVLPPTIDYLSNR